MIDKTTVTRFSFARYLGTWYEIARFDHHAEKGLEDITATYQMGHDGKIHVYNSGFRNNKPKKVKGRVKFPDFSDPAKMQISFFLWFYFDYWVLELDHNYEWIVIGSSKDKYLWILSRTPSLTPKVYDSIIARVKKRGYPVEDLITVKHHS